jgi:hypothetical protein
MDHCLKKGERLVFAIIKTLVLMFTSLMNLFLKRQTLEVYQVKDQSNNLTIFN